MTDATTEPVPSPDPIPTDADTSDAASPAVVPPASAAAGPVPPRVRPRVRVAAIVWGLVLAAIGAGAIWLVWDRARMNAVTSWAVDASPSAWTVVAIGAVLVVGVIILVGSVLGAVHRAQDRARRDPAN